MSRKGHKGKGHDDAGEVTVTCPCCSTRLLVNATTGVVLREDRPRRKAPGKSFEDAVKEEEARRSASDELFGEALRSQKDRQSLLDRKFEEAMKKAAENPDEKPPNPFDQD